MNRLSFEVNVRVFLKNETSGHLIVGKKLAVSDFGSCMQPDSEVCMYNFAHCTSLAIWVRDKITKRGGREAGK